MATSNSNLLQPKIEDELFQQLETQLLDTMEIPEQYPSHSLKLEDMPPEVVENQPVTDVPTVGGSSIVKNTPHALTKNHCDFVHKYMKDNGKIPVQFRKKDGRPVGKYASVFKTELGLAVKKFVPLQVSGWRSVTAEQKWPIFDWLESAFTVEFGLGPSLVKKETEKMISRRFRDYRLKMHEHYKTLIHLPWEDRLKYVPKEFCKSEADWEFMCKLFESDNFKKASFINSGNRGKSKPTYVYRGGSKSLSQYEYDADGGSEGKEDNALSNVTNNSRKGCPVDSAETVDFNDEQIGLDKQDYGSQSLEKVELVEEIHVGSDAATTTLIAELRKEVASTQNELCGTRSALELAEERIRTLEANQKSLEEAVQSNRQIVEANQRMMKQVFERLASDIAQSFSQQPN